LGTSGYMVHTLASALYCFLRMPNDFEETIAAGEGGHK
jgi:ADP-ribosylglycohydrolase